jgi:nucleoside-diphosphate-sugar epimerase
MRVFITGASGWIGSALIPELIGAGHEVVGMVRSDASAAAIEQLGAEVVRGDLDDLDVLREGALENDGVIHLAFKVPSISETATQADANAIGAFADALSGTGKPLIVSGGTLVTPGRVATEHDEIVAVGPIAARLSNMKTALAASERDVRSSLVMLPRSVHGTGEHHGFIPQLINLARSKGVVGYIGDGSSRWPAVHVKDAAVLYRLALEKATAGSVLNAVGDEGVSVRAISEAIGRHLGLPAMSLPAEEFPGMFSFLMSTDMPASSAFTQQLMGWTPTHPGLIDDIEAGHYFE